MVEIKQSKEEKKVPLVKKSTKYHYDPNKDIMETRM